MGTLNLVTPDVRRMAIGTVTEGRVISLGTDLDRRWSRKNSDPPVHRMHLVSSSNAISCVDSISVATHGFAITHLDAPAHVFFDGLAYNGRRAADVVTPAGMVFGSISAVREGVMTRGVLLDVARVKGVPFLPATYGISVEDLEVAEADTGVRVRSGDAVFVRIGLAAREAVEGEEDPSQRCGLLPECIPWLFDREAALFSGDCVERIPSGFERVPLPLHQVGSVAMGLALLDNAAVEDLAVDPVVRQRSTFLLVCTPLRIPGGTGSPVNPIAVV